MNYMKSFESLLDPKEQTDMVGQDRAASSQFIALHVDVKKNTTVSLTPTPTELAR